MFSDERHGFGPKLPDIEGGKDTIREVIGKLQSIMSGNGVRIGKRVTIEGPEVLNLDLSILEDTPTKLKITLNGTLPRVNLSGWLKGDIVGALISEEKIVIEIDGLPDATLKVVS
jgi:hypothetical protein